MVPLNIDAEGEGCWWFVPFSSDIACFTPPSFAQRLGSFSRRPSFTVGLFRVRTVDSPRDGQHDGWLDRLNGIEKELFAEACKAISGGAAYWGVGPHQSVKPVC